MKTLCLFFALLLPLYAFADVEFDYDGDGEIDVTYIPEEVALEAGGNTWTGAQDMSGATLELPNSTSLPGSCNAGEIYINTDATSGEQVYVCESGSWVQQGGSGGSGSVSDDAFDGGWNGVADTAPSQNAVYDKFMALTAEVDPYPVYMLESNIGTGASNYLQLDASPGSPDGSKFLRDDMTWQNVAAANQLDGMTDVSGDGTADSILRDNGDGTFTFVDYFDRPSRTSAPGSPVTGRVYKADNDTWDPATIDGTVDYWVVYDGANYVALRDDSGNRFHGSLELPNTSSGDQTLTAAQIGLKTDEDLIAVHGGAAGEVQDEAGISLIQKVVAPFDPENRYDNTTNHVVTLMRVGDSFPHGITITEWSAEYLNGDPTTELDADLMCDTTPDWNPAAGATVMDVIDTTAGASSADSGFDSATCANGSRLYIRFGADPVDSGETIHFEVDFYANED